MGNKFRLDGILYCWFADLLDFKNIEKENKNIRR
jgi:hypothetical protein